MPTILGNRRHTEGCDQLQPFAHMVRVPASHIFQDKSLMDDFSKSFDNADFVILTDIYAAREADTGEVNSSMLAELIARTGKKAVYIKDFGSIVELLDKNVKSGDLVITMGAGDVYKVGDMFLESRKKLAVS